MSGETHDPAIGPPRSSDRFTPGAVSPADSPADPAEQGRAAPLAPYSSSSGDELNALLAESIVEPHPDPLLGSFSSGEQPAVPVAPETDGTASPSEAVPEESLPAESAPVSSAEIEGPSDPPQEAPAPSVGSFDALSALASVTGQEPAGSVAPSDDIAFPVVLVTESSKGTTPARDESRKEENEEEDDEEEEEFPPKERSWLTLLLISYSSAVTLGLLWVLLGGRRLHESDEADLFPASANRADPGRRANQSRRLEPPQPLAADHLTSLGQTVRLGSLEVTPLEVRRGPVELERVFDDGEERDGGDDALRLRLRLKNVSPDTIFVPLDEAFLREPIGGGPDSFIETANGATIAMYPLAIESEWTIRGQSFEELQPGQTRDAEVVSESKVSDRLAPAMTWRVRLRTGIEKTDTLGIRFRKDDVR